MNLQERMPSNGEIISMESGKLVVPNKPIIPFIEGDGIGPDVWHASKKIIDAAIKKSYEGEKEIKWLEVYAGEKANVLTGSWLPDETVEMCNKFLVAIKGPLTTPIGGGIRSLNVALRQVLDLYVCLRPVRWFEGVPSPAGGILVLTPLILSLSGFNYVELNYEIITPIFFITTSFLLISKFPSYSFKKIVIQRKATIFLLFSIILFFGLLLIYTFEVIAISSVIYLSILPISFFHYQKMKKIHENEKIQDEEDLEDVL